MNHRSVVQEVRALVSGPEVAGSSPSAPAYDGWSTLRLRRRMRQLNRTCSREEQCVWLWSLVDVYFVRMIKMRTVRRWINADLARKEIRWELKQRGIPK